MFIEINGHLVNSEHIVQVTPTGGVQLLGGSVLHAKDNAELDQIRVQLIFSASGPLYAPAESHYDGCGCNPQRSGDQAGDGAEKSGEDGAQ